MCKILTVENQTMIRIALLSILEKQYAGATLHSTTSLNEMREMMSDNSYNLIIIGSSIEASKTEYLLDLLKRYPSTSILVLSENPVKLPFQKLYMNGIGGIIDKAATIDEIEAAIKQVFEGRIYINPHSIKRIFSNVEEDNQLLGLTYKQNIVAKLLVEGKTNTQICELLKLQPSTISTFKLQVFKKLGVHNLVELKREARRLV